MNKLSDILSSDNSSGDEDVDGLLQKATEKLGWSSHKNYEDTFQMLLKNVEDSKKKRKPCSTKSKRQTQRFRNIKPSSPILSPTEVPTPKRILSFSNDVDVTKEKPETGDDDSTRGRTSQTPVNSIITLSNHVSSHYGDIRKTVTASDILKNHDSTQTFTVCKPELSHLKKQTSPDRCLSDPSLGKTDVKRHSSSKVLPSIEFTTDDRNGTSETPGCYHDSQHNGCVASGNDHSWLNHRGDKDEGGTSSDSDEDKSLPVVSLKDEDHSEEEEEFEVSTPPSLSQRLVNNRKKRKENGIGDDQRWTENKKCDGDSKSQNKKSLCYNNSSSSDDDVDFENFLMKMKTPQKTQSSGNQYFSSDGDDDGFINDSPITEGEEEEDDEYLMHLKLNNEISPAGEIHNSRDILRDHTNKVKSPKDQDVIHFSSDESGGEDDVFVSPVKPKRKAKNKENLHLPPKTPVNKPVLEKKISFLESLNTPPVGTPVRSEFVKDFKKKKEELARRLFTMFNKTVFEGKLPVDMEIRWNKRMRKTAGYCVYTKGKLNGSRNVRLELSEKVCDSAERLRDTLVHEMCHAACWLINGVNDGHGRYWKYWAWKVNVAHPEIPVVKRCHSYEIHTKYKYQCQQCKAVVGRHSKSIDVSKKCCGLCKGRFILLPPENQKQNKRQQPNKFALFVKENYASVKKSNNCLKHADVMRALSQEFARKATLDE